MEMKDSGERQKFQTGAVRDTATGKPRPDLISPHAAMREGVWLGLGAEKYQPRNWEKGIPISRCIASLERHLVAYKLGLRDEDHMAAVRTNAGFILHFEEEVKAGRLPASLDDMPHYLSQPMQTPAACSDDANIKRRRDLLKRVDSGEMLSDRENGELHVSGCDNDGCGLEGRLCPECMATLSERIDKGAARVMAGQQNVATGSPAWWNEADPNGSIRGIKKPFTVYLCGPITGAPIDHNWRNYATDFLVKHGIRTLDPLRGKKSWNISNQGMSYEGQLASPEMADRDNLDVQAADLILAHFPYEPPRQSIGSLMEMGGAAGIGGAKPKPIVLCTEIPAFNDHLFTRRFCIIEPMFQKALDRIVEWFGQRGQA